VLTVNDVTRDVAVLLAVSFATTDQVHVPFVKPESCAL
jgi:hypothetical protein